MPIPTANSTASQGAQRSRSARKFSTMAFSGDTAGVSPLTGRGSRDDPVRSTDRRARGVARPDNGIVTLAARHFITH